MSLIAVIMKAPTSAIRFNNATSLLNYGFTNFEFVSLAKKGDIIQTVNINKGTSPVINAVCDSDVGGIVSKGNDFNINKSISLPDYINAPVQKDDIIGTISFSLNDESLGIVNLISNNTVKRLNFGNMLASVVERWFCLLR